MSTFQIGEELGHAKRLIGPDDIDTPILLSSSGKLSYKNIEIKQAILTEEGPIIINTDPINQILDSSKIDKSIDKLPEWVILNPRFVIEDDILVESQEYELVLFLDRLARLELPKTFGVPYAPFFSPDWYIEEILKLNPSIIVIHSQPLETLSPRKILELFIKIDRVIPPDIALYLPGGVPIGFQSIVIALGIDILDDNSIYRMASKKFSFIDNSISYEREIENYDQLIKINHEELYRDFQGVRYHLAKNTLWTRIAKDMHVHPSIAALVTLLPKSELLQYHRFSSHRRNKLKFTGEESLYHPDVVKYRSTLVKNYSFPVAKKILILLPCAAKKPYSESRSHKIFKKTIKSASKGRVQDITIWSLTSPMGVVPHELETIYPNQYYDLPVTGNWSHEENKVTGQLLHNMIDKIPSDTKILVHVSSGYKEMVEIGLAEHEYTVSWIDSKPTSKDALHELWLKIKDLLPQDKERDRIRYSKLVDTSMTTIQGLIQFNHGKKAIVDLHDIKLYGRFPRPVQVKRGKSHLLTWSTFDGKVNLSLEIAKTIARSSEKWIEVDTDELRGSSIYAVGVTSASDIISPGDEILIFTNNKNCLLGIGTANFSGLTIQKMRRGIVAKIRKKSKIILEEES